MNKVKMQCTNDDSVLINYLDAE